MKITTDMKVEISPTISQKKYISIEKKGKTLIVNSTSKKPRGAKATLEKIQKILEAIDIDDQSKISLAKISDEINTGYAKKNDRKFLYKHHSKKVHRLADRIAFLSKVPALPADVISILGHFADIQMLGRLAQVNKAAGGATAMEWSARAKALGWPGKGDARAFCRNITWTLDRMGFHSFANQLILYPEMEFNWETLNVLVLRLRHSVLTDNLESLLRMLVHKTKNFNGPLFFNPQEAFFYFDFPRLKTGKKHEGCLHNLFSSSPLLPYANFLANLGVQSPDLTRFASINMDHNHAKAVLDLFPQANLNALRIYRKYQIEFKITPLFEAVAKGNLGWVKALLKKHVDINKPLIKNSRGIISYETPIERAIKLKNSEIISLLTQAGAEMDDGHLTS